MAQLNFYVPDEIEEAIRKEARSKRKTISSYLAQVVKESVRHDQWQKDFFKKVVSGWKGDFPKITRPLPEEREDF